MIKRSFNITEEVDKRLELLAEAEGLNKTAMLTVLINQEYKKNLLLKNEKEGGLSPTGR
jgi:hypothetical protein